MARASRRFVLGLIAAGLIAAAGFGLESVALPAPSRADRVAAQAATWLQAHRLVVDGFRVDGSEAAGACLRGWFSNGGERPARGSLLVVGPGTTWLAFGLRSLSLVRGRRSGALTALLEATVGCAGELRDLIFEGVRTGVLTVRPTRAAGQSVLALTLPRLDYPQLTVEVSGRTHRLLTPRLRDERLTLYVSPVTHRPVLAAVDGERKVSVHLRGVGATPAILAELRRAGAPRPNRRG